jgi:4-amino-4-deoxy-L-arabinose transferase-like glycosyltransferase
MSSSVESLARDGDRSAAAASARLFLALAAGATALRIAALFFADADLGPDEAQYWFWSRTPDFGYFSKPPLIAWAIAASTALFGDAEWAVRLPAPLFHFGAAVLIFALARRLYGAAAAFWAGLGWITLPGVALSSALMTTDAPLLFFWAAALLFFFRMAAPAGSGDAGAAFGLGASVGLGLLAKYAMIYFVIGAVLAAALAPEIRRRLRLRDAAIAGGAALLILAPNLLWNAAHDFQTIAHTAANADWGRDMFRPAALAEFLAAQFGVFGPAFLFLLIWSAATLARRLAETPGARAESLALLAFAIPPLLIVSAQAFLSRAHANWAAVAYPSAMILIAGFALRAGLGAALKASVALHAAAAAVFAVVFANFALADALGLSNAVKRLRGWEAAGAQIRAAAAPFDAIVVDDRETMASLLYYARGGAELRAWNSNQRIDHHFEAFMAFDPAAGGRALFVSLEPSAHALLGRYDKVAPVGEVRLATGPARARTFHLFAVDGLLAAP